MERASYGSAQKKTGPKRHRRSQDLFQLRQNLETGTSWSSERILVEIYHKADALIAVLTGLG